MDAGRSPGCGDERLFGSRAYSMFLGRRRFRDLTPGANGCAGTRNRCFDWVRVESFAVITSGARTRAGLSPSGHRSRSTGWSRSVRVGDPGVGVPRWLTRSHSTPAGFCSPSGRSGCRLQSWRSPAGRSAGFAGGSPESGSRPGPASLAGFGRDSSRPAWSSVTPRTGTGQPVAKLRGWGPLP